jgi:hypothetical protein
MRRRDLAWLAVFPDPFTSGPVSEVIGPTRVILEDDNFTIPRCGLDRLAHVKYAYFDGVIGPFLLHFANTGSLFHPWRSLKLTFWLGYRYPPRDWPRPARRRRLLRRLRLPGLLRLR